MKFLEFSKRMEDMELECVKLEMMFNEADSRLWTAVINPSSLSLIVVFHVNKEDYRHRSYDLHTPNRIITDLNLNNLFDKIYDLRG